MTIRQLAQQDALRTVDVRIADELGAIALLESLGYSEGFDIEFAKLELDRYRALKVRILNRIAEEN